MIPVVFHIGPIPVYSFGAFMALAAVAGGWIAWLELKRYGYDPEISSSLFFAGAIGGLPRRHPRRELGRAPRRYSLAEGGGYLRAGAGAGVWCRTDRLPRSGRRRLG